MLTSRDGSLTVLIGDPWSVNYYPADWSVHVIPPELDQAMALSRHLYNTPTTKHVTLLFPRSRRDDRVLCLANVKGFCENWIFLETVSIIYEKPSSCSNAGLLPISETGFLLYKGKELNIRATQWFSDNKTNATNCWDLGVNNLEKELAGVKYSYYQKFSWEMNLLLYSMCKPLAARSFIWSIKLTDQEIGSIKVFCKTMNVKSQVVVKNLESAEKLLSVYNEL